MPPLSQKIQPYDASRLGIDPTSEVLTKDSPSLSVIGLSCGVLLVPHSACSSLSVSTGFDVIDAA